MTGKTKADRLAKKFEEDRRVAAVAQRAAALIRNRGWCVGAMTDDSGRLCLMGAVREAASTVPGGRHIKYRAYDEVNKRIRRAECRIQDWNDEQTDPDKVATLLDQVAVDLCPGMEPVEVCWHGVPVCQLCGCGRTCSASDDRCRADSHRMDCRVRDDVPWNVIPWTVRR